MLARVAGSIMVFTACAVLGLYYSLREGFRIADLTEMKKALLLLKGEIDFTHSPLPEAMAHVSIRLQPKFTELFAQAGENMGMDHMMNASQAWKTALAAAHSGFHFNGEDMHSLNRLGETLGYLGKSTQAEGIDMTVLYIDSQIERLRESEARNQRLYRSAGIIFGLLIIIVLI